MEILAPGLRVTPPFFQTNENVPVMAFGEPVARELSTLPILNAGVFALRRDLPHWSLWADLLRAGLQRRGPAPLHRLIEQCSLNLAVYKHGLATHLLPVSTICLRVPPFPSAASTMIGLQYDLVRFGRSIRHRSIPEIGRAGRRRRCRVRRCANRTHRRRTARLHSEHRG